MKKILLFALLIQALAFVPLFSMDKALQTSEVTVEIGNKVAGADVNESEICTVCQEDLSQITNPLNEQEYILQKCGHRYHKKCITEWHDRTLFSPKDGNHVSEQKCPSCNKKFKMKLPFTEDRVIQLIKTFEKVAMSSEEEILQFVHAIVGTSIAVALAAGRHPRPGAKINNLLLKEFFCPSFFAVVMFFILFENPKKLTRLARRYCAVGSFLVAFLAVYIRFRSSKYSYSLLIKFMLPLVRFGSMLVQVCIVACLHSYLRKFETASLN